MRRKEKLEVSEEVSARLRLEYPLYYLEMNDAQDRFVRVRNGKGKTPRRRLFEAGNKVGKTYQGLAEDISYAVGYRCWLPSWDKDYKVDIKVPNVGLIACETMMHSVVEKIEPGLKMLVPKVCNPVWKPGPTGTLIRVTLPFGCFGEKCGSVIHIRSYDQRPDTFEGIDSDWIHYDEPPPLGIFKATERGKIVSNAASWLTMTPLKEAWWYDMLSTKAAVHA